MLLPDLKSDSDFAATQPEVNKLTAFARAIVIKTAKQYEDAADYLKSIKGMLKRIEEARTRVTKPLNESLREVNRQAKEASDPLALAEAQIKSAMVAHQNEQERLRLEQQRQADEVARKERDRIETQRREAEAKARAEQDRLRKEAEAAAAAGRTAEAAKLAAKAASVAEKSAARDAALEERSAMVVAPVIQREAPKVSGISAREVWRYEITDPDLLPREYTIPDEKAIGGVVRSLKGNTRIAGVRVWKDTSMAAGSA